MAKASIKKIDGTSIIIEGGSEEIAKILKKLDSQDLPNEYKTEDTRKTKHKKKSKKVERTKAKVSMPDLVEELKEEGFFDKPRSLVEIKNAFSEKGHIYSIYNISTPILRLIRKRVIGRIKEGKKWLYVKR